LIVDDNAANLGALSDVLDRAGYEVAVARDGAMALEQVDHEAPDLILLDVKMPGMDGFEVCRRLKEDPSSREIPVMFMTALSDQVDKVRGLELGAVDYIGKPVASEEVLARVKVQLKLRALTRALMDRNAELEREVKERTSAEEALKDLTVKLEQRVAERTAELSRVVTELKDTQAKLKGSIHGLESEVASRVDDLQRANERLGQELAERLRAEEARAALQAQVIEAQQARLAEMSTPLIPITDDIMVMPLVGAMEEDRAEQVMVSALEGVVSKRARVVIIDITGVKRTDASVAGALVRTAQALRLLGAQTVITGIRPEVAQALVDRTLDLKDVVTRGTLQSGIGYALQLSSSASW
jgi:DNA-binding response OmpR family regulator/anti-anti-sigma regulatory factor